MKRLINIGVTLCSILMMGCQPANELRLNEMDITSMTAGWGTPQINKSVQSKPLTIAGQVFENGVGTHASSTILINLEGNAGRITGKVGVDDEAAEPASVNFMLIGDQKVLWESGVMQLGDSVVSFDVGLRGINKLGLLASGGDDGINYDHADWVEVRIDYHGEVPTPCLPVVEEPYLLTPPPPAEPRINGPEIYGVRPGSPFLYRIPCTGERPIEFSVVNLPSGLSLNSSTGIISGKVAERGQYYTQLVATNAKGEAVKDFFIIVGDTLMLTPSMGWNSWYIHYDRVSDSIIRNAADQMIATGMADYGYQYVNIDDCWMVKAGSDDPIVGGDMRDKNGKLLTNKRFPNMKSMTDYIHDKGLKAGTYIGPGPTTCAGYTASWEHEAQDALTFAEWGFDFLKYDWCSYSQIAPDKSRQSYIAPYQLMWNELQKQNRDIVLNLCQYGMDNVWEWGGQVGNSWRTTGDLGLQRGQSMPGFYYIGRSNAEHWQFAKRGNWNDPDYILIGWVGSAFEGGLGEKTTLTPSEQYSYMSMWSLMASPLIFSGDMGKLDEFTLNVLCNHEVIEVNQDPLGIQGRIIRETDTDFVMVKPLKDNSIAVGIFHKTGESDSPAEYFDWGNREPVELTVTASELGIKGDYTMRDLWRQQYLGSFSGNYTCKVPYHGVQLIKLTPTN